MKKVVSISVGSSTRDHDVTCELLGQRVHIWREGTDGDFAAAIRKIKEYDGVVDAFGLGGADFLCRAAGHDYYFRDAKQFSNAAVWSPIVCGSGLKGATEADVVRFMREELDLSFTGKRVLVTSAMDRWGLAMALADAGCEMTYADLLYALGIPIMIHSRTMLVALIRAIARPAVQLPFSFLYPYDSDHKTKVESESKYSQLYRDADIIAGDYKYVRKYMPKDMRGKWVITNTTTGEDVEFLRSCGVELLVTTTPRFGDRSFGTNVIEAALIALEGASSALSEARYLELYHAAGFRPDAQWLQQTK